MNILQVVVQWLRLSESSWRGHLQFAPKVLYNVASALTLESFGKASPVRSKAYCPSNPSDAASDQKVEGMIYSWEPNMVCIYCLIESQLLYGIGSSAVIMYQ